MWAWLLMIMGVVTYVLARAKNCARVARPSLRVLVMQYIQRCGVVWLTRLYYFGLVIKNVPKVFIYLATRGLMILPSTFAW